MANPNSPFGFLENGLEDGYMPTFGIKTGYLSASNTNSIYGGDVAKPLSSGYYDVFTSVTSGGETIGGIFLPDFRWLSKSANKLVYARAWTGQTGDIVSGTVECKVLILGNALLRVRSAGDSGSAVGQANVGQFANFKLGTVGANLLSAMTLDDSTLTGTQGNLPFQVYSIDQPPVSDPTSIYNTVLVKMVNLAL